MLTSPLDSGTVQAALELAARAPSVHNSQPWRWRLDGEVISLRADLRRWLPLTDPDGRDLVLSCGAALHHLQVALAALGVPATVIRMPDPDEPDLLASVRLEAPLDAPGATDAAAALQARRSDRRRYSDWPVEQIQLAELSAAAAAYGAVLRVVPDGPARGALDEALRLASAAHAATTGYDTELSLWSGLLTGDEGVPARNVPATGGPRRFAGTGDLPEGAPIDGAVLLVLGTSSDDQLSWLRAGEAMSAVLLAATALGLASCPLSEPLELEGTRALVRDQVLDGTLSPQIVLRVGWAPVGDPLPATPRRRLADQTD
jgi:nitroreductase